MGYSERDGLRIGDSASLRLEIDDNLVTTFAEITLDKNPVHLDESYASKTRFGKRIAHGMIAAARQLERDGVARSSCR